jgi:hypothetical protein
VAVLTKYDVLVDSSIHPEKYGFFEGIKSLRGTEDLGKKVDPMDSTAGTPAYRIDSDALSRAENTLCKMIAPFENMLGDLGVPWVKVSGLHILPLVLSARSNRLILKTVKPEFTYTLDELVDMTQQRINNSLEPIWVITQQRRVEPKVQVSIESVPLFCDATNDCADICKVLARKVRFKVYFWFCIHHVQEYWQGLSTSFKLVSGGKSLERRFKEVHRDIVTYSHCFLHIFAISCP